MRLDTPHGRPRRHATALETVSVVVPDEAVEHYEAALLTPAARSGCSSTGIAACGSWKA